MKSIYTSILKTVISFGLKLLFMNVLSLSFNEVNEDNFQKL